MEKLSDRLVKLFLARSITNSEWWNLLLDHSELVIEDWWNDQPGMNAQTTRD